MLTGVYWPEDIERLNKAFDRGNYASAYDGERPTVLPDDTEEQHAYLLGFFSSYEAEEVPDDWYEDYCQAHRSQVGKLARLLGWVEDEGVGL